MHSSATPAKIVDDTLHASIHLPLKSLDHSNHGIDLITHIVQRGLDVAQLGHKALITFRLADLG